MGMGGRVTTRSASFREKWMMALSVAMALFALQADNCSEELKDVYNCGIALIDDKNIRNTIVHEKDVTERSGANFQSVNETKAEEAESRKKATVTDHLQELLTKSVPLDLQNSWKVPHAMLEGGVNCFFENRSQLSRLANLPPPPCLMVICNDPECQFAIPHYALF